MPVTISALCSCKLSTYNLNEISINLLFTFIGNNIIMSLKSSSWSENQFVLVGATWGSCEPWMRPVDPASLPLFSIIRLSFWSLLTEKIEPLLFSIPALPGISSARSRCPAWWSRRRQARQWSTRRWGRRWRRGKVRRRRTSRRNRLSEQLLGEFEFQAVTWWPRGRTTRISWKSLGSAFSSGN